MIVSKRIAFIIPVVIVALGAISLTRLSPVTTFYLPVMSSYSKSS